MGWRYHGWQVRNALMRKPILAYLATCTYWETATEIAHGMGKAPAQVSSVMTELFREGLVEKKEGVGPRGGQGYRLPPPRDTYKTWHERLDTTLSEM